MPEDPQNTRRVGVYDRPATADRPRSARFIWIAVVVIAVVIAVIYYTRR